MKSALARSKIADSYRGGLSTKPYSRRHARYRCDNFTVKISDHQYGVGNDISQAGLSFITTSHVSLLKNQEIIVELETRSDKADYQVELKLRVASKRFDFKQDLVVYGCYILNELDFDLDQFLCINAMLEKDRCAKFSREKSKREKRLLPEVKVHHQTEFSHMKLCYEIEHIVIALEQDLSKVCTSEKEYDTYSLVTSALDHIKNIIIKSR